MTCSFGQAPATLAVPPTGRTNTEGAPTATIMHFVPLDNVPPFGLCTSPSNPAVDAALGAPQPCVPVLEEPWEPGSPSVAIGSIAALSSTSRCL
jgi:hypothetical protein